MGYQFGFIGTGNMGGALATAVCKQAGPKEVLLSDKTASKAEALAEKLECTASDSLSVAGSCRYIFLGVKPQMIEALFSEIRPVLQKRTDRFLLVTMAAGLSMDEIDFFLLHQANLRIIEAVAKRLHQPMEKFPTNLQKYGNISSASVPILLDNVNNHGMIGEGSKIVLAGFGAGLTWGAAVLRWQAV